MRILVNFSFSSRQVFLLFDSVLMLLQRQSSQERAKLKFIPTYQCLSVTRTVQNDILASHHNIHHEGQ